MIALPFSLTLLRLLLGPLAILLAAEHFSRLAYAPLLLLGILSDIFDGILARRLGVSQPWLRRFDSMTDLFYYLCVLWTTWMVAGDVLRQSVIYLCLLLGSELACMVVSLVRFGAMPATHCYSAKIYGIALFCAFVGVLAFNAGKWAFAVLTVFGLVANAEVILVLLLSARSPIDIPTVLRLRSTPNSSQE